MPRQINYITYTDFRLFFRENNGPERRSLALKDSKADIQKYLMHFGGIHVSQTNYESRLSVAIMYTMIEQLTSFQAFN